MNDYPKSNKKEVEDKVKQIHHQTLEEDRILDIFQKESLTERAKDLIQRGGFNYFSLQIKHVDKIMKKIMSSKIIKEIKKVRSIF